MIEANVFKRLAALSPQGSISLICLILRSSSQQQAPPPTPREAAGPAPQLPQQLSSLVLTTGPGGLVSTPMSRQCQTRSRLFSVCFLTCEV